MNRSFLTQNASLVGEDTETRAESAGEYGCCFDGDEALTLEAIRITEAIGPITSQLQMKLASASVHLVEAGMLLLRAKDMLAHGQFQPWLRENFKMSGKTANRLMSLAKMVSKYDLNPETISKLMNLDLNIIYEIAAKSTPEAIQRQILCDLAVDQAISYEEVRGLKKQSRDVFTAEPDLNDLELRKFLRLLKQFSQWFDDHEAELQTLPAPDRSELKIRLEAYALQLKSVSDTVNGLLAHTEGESGEIIYIFPEVPSAKV